MNILKLFRKRNKISQLELAEHLGVTQGFISQMENGTSAVPDGIISKILANTRGWETQMLVEDETAMPENETSSSELLDYFRSKVAEQEQEIIELHSKIAVLEYQIMMLEREKGKSASGAASTIANAG